MIVCCGEALVDMVPDGERPDAFLAKPGGCPYNTAIAAGRLGTKVSFLGRIGTDFLGTRLYDHLISNGVDVSIVARRDQAATLAFVSRDAQGNARYAFYSEGAADRSFATEDLPPKLPPETRFLMIGSISMVEEPIATTVEALAGREWRNLMVSLDPNIRPGFIRDRAAYIERLERWTALSSIVKTSSDDLEWLYPGLPPEACLDRILARGPVLAIATLGADGVMAKTSAADVFLPSFKVEVADTIGAGDTFHAALLARLDAEGYTNRDALTRLDASGLERMLRFPNAAAAVNCTRTGAEPPTEPETRAFLAARGFPDA